MSAQEVQKIHADMDSSGETPRKSVLKTTASYIITTEFCERLAYYGAILHVIYSIILYTIIY